MSTINNYIQKKLNDRLQQGNYRKLKSDNKRLVDFYSNDYLGFARSKTLRSMIAEEMQRHDIPLNGSTGSRLLAGNTDYAIELEQQISAEHHCEAGLIFNSGYDANLGLFSSLPQRGDTVLHDELIHASIIDGIRLSYAKRQSFRHNNLQHLEQKLQRCAGRCFVAVESVYSMDGDVAPIQAIGELCHQFGASLIVDEAHATGLFNQGIIQQLNLHHLVFARVITFGKALGTHGAIVLGSELLIKYLVNFARSFIYTTAAPFHQLVCMKMSYILLKQSGTIIEQLKSNILTFKQNLTNCPGLNIIESNSAIQCIIIGSALKAKKVSMVLQKNGFDVRAILSPTVAEGTERLRICLHSFNTTEEITQLTNFIKNLTHE